MEFASQIYSIIQMKSLLIAIFQIRTQWLVSGRNAKISINPLDKIFTYPEIVVDR